MSDGHTWVEVTSAQYAVLKERRQFIKIVKEKILAQKKLELTIKTALKITNLCLLIFVDISSYFIVLPSVVCIVIISRSKTVNRFGATA